MAKTFDLTQTIATGMQVFSLHSPTHVLPWAPREQHGWATNALFINEHAGTHLDAPVHFVPGGATVEDIDIAKLSGPARALDLSHLWPRGQITAEELDKASAAAPAEKDEALVLRTGAETHLGTDAYLSDYPGLDRSGAQWVVDRGIRLVGTDAPSIDQPGASGFPAHHVLLPSGVLVVENLADTHKLIECLREKSGREPFVLHTFPLKIAGGTGSPIRAVAVVHG